MILNNSLILWSSEGVRAHSRGIEINALLSPFQPKPFCDSKSWSLLGCCGSDFLWVLVPRSRLSIFIQAVAGMKLVVSKAACMRLCSGLVTKNIGYTAVFWLLLSRRCQHRGFIFVLFLLHLLPVSRLEVGEKLGRSTGSHIWSQLPTAIFHTRWHCAQHQKLWEKDEKVGTFVVMGFVFPSNCQCAKLLVLLCLLLGNCE